MKNGRKILALLLALLMLGSLGATAFATDGEGAQGETTTQGEADTQSVDAAQNGEKTDEETKATDGYTQPTDNSETGTDTQSTAPEQGIKELLKAKEELSAQLGAAESDEEKAKLAEDAAALDARLLAKVNEAIAGLPDAETLKTMSDEELGAVNEEINTISDALDALGLDIDSDKLTDAAKLSAAAELLNSRTTEADNTSTDVYVSATGSDETGDGTREKPYASLSKAADYVNNSNAGTEFTAHVMSDLTSTACGRFCKSVTIVGEGGKWTITRGANFAQLQDNARSTYNPAILEIAVPASYMTVRNLTLDDAGIAQGSRFVQQSTDGSGGNGDIVQDAIIASYAYEPCAINLYGVTLANFGGMSAIRVTSSTTLNMDASSSIIGGGTNSASKASGDYGTAGAIWCQGATANMNGTISGVTGRAIYIDGGTAAVGGTIKNITADSNAWQGDSGTAIHVRNGSSATLTGTIGGSADEENNTKGSAVFIDSGCTFSMENGSVVQNLKSNGIYCNGGTLTINGEITGLKGRKNPVTVTGGTAVCTLGTSGNIHGNEGSYGAIYIQSCKTVDIYGNISENVCSRGGAIGLPGHGNAIVNMYDGATIKNNTAKKTGGGLEVKQLAVFTMYGGEISGNTAGEHGGGISLDCDNGGNTVGQVIIKGGVIKDNTMGSGISNDLSISNRGGHFGSVANYLSVASEAELGDENIYFAVGGKTVSATRNTELGNASSGSITNLTNASAAKGWTSPIATFWAQNDSVTDYTVGGLTLAQDKLSGATLPVYVLTQKTGESGTPADGAEVKVYAAKVENGNVTFSLPASDTNGNGCAVALVQPTADYGSVVITGPEQLCEEENKTSYEVPYVSTYTMSENLKNQIELYQKGINDKTCVFSFTVQLDPRLTAKTGEGDYEFTSPIFEIASVEGSGSTLTAHVKLKSDWKDHIDDLTETPMVLTGTGTGSFNSDDFAAHTVLNTTGTIQGSINGGGVKLSIFIPANNCQTELIPLKSVTLSFDANGGAGTAPADMSAYLDSTGKAEFTIPESTLSRNGYTLQGWSKTADGSADYKAGDKISISADTTLYAVWGTEQTPSTPTPIPIESTVDIRVNKVWSDNSNAEGERPGYVTMQLYKDGEAYLSSVTLDASNGWTYTWEGLDGDHEYTVKETNVPKGYYAMTKQRGNVITITNTYGVKTGDESNLALWLTLAGVSLAGAAAAVIITRKKRGTAK